MKFIQITSLLIAIVTGTLATLLIATAVCNNEFQLRDFTMPIFITICYILFTVFASCKDKAGLLTSIGAYLLGAWIFVGCNLITPGSDTIYLHTFMGILFLIITLKMQTKKYGK